MAFLFEKAARTIAEKEGPKPWTAPPHFNHVLAFSQFVLPGRQNLS